MNVIPTAQHLPFPQSDTPNFSAGGQPWYSTGNQDMQSTLPSQPPVEQTSGEQIWFSSGTHNIRPVTPLQQNGNHNAQSGTEEHSAEVVSLERIYCFIIYRIMFSFYLILFLVSGEECYG